MQIAYLNCMTRRRGMEPAQVPAASSAGETLDAGVVLRSPVSLACFDRRPLRFGGKIHQVEVGRR